MRPVDRVALEHVYGVVGSGGWGYHAIDVTNSFVVYGGSIRQDGELFHMFLSPVDEGNGKTEDIGSRCDPFSADNALRQKLLDRAVGVLGKSG